MDLSEFKKLSEYSKHLKSKSNEVDPIRPAHFNTMVLPMLKVYDNENTIMVRDFLDVDSTFAVVAQGEMPLELAVKLMLDVQEVIGAAVYMNPTRTGLINLSSGDNFVLTGFWTLFQ